MASARRVTLAPPEAWDEARLLDAARALPAKAEPVRVGDEMAGLVVVGVEPEPGAAPDAETVFDVLPRPRPVSAPLVDVAVLLDVSESMALPWSADLTRSEAARAALSSFLHDGGAGVGRVTVLAFAREAWIAAGPVDHAKMTTFDVPAPAGAARTGPALDAALAHLAQTARDDRVQAVLLLTDGVGDADATREAAARAGRLGVPVHALVFAPEADAVLDDLARLTRGSRQLATLPLTLQFVHHSGSDAA